MARALFNGVVIAESSDIETVEGNAYFPPSSLKQEYFSDNSKTTRCFWKGTAKYYDVTVDGKTATAGAWYYPDPKSAASNIKDYVAFWNGVVVES